MKDVKLFVFLLAIGVAAAGCTTGSDNTSSDEVQLFNRVSSERTNITFANNLSENPTPHRTELLYEYFSNGAGVSVGDVNGDGLDDIYFTGNMRYNKLYLNRGGLKFEDATAAAGVRGRKNTWNTGVSMADVNGDGRLDIYVCYSGELPLDRRVDQLFINQGPNSAGIPVFEEQASEYGLANPHSSNQAYFFDYDRDGDLDLYLQTHNVKTLPRGNSRTAQETTAQQDSVNGNRFYENREGRFVDVTGTVGIESSPLTYGLGAGISDVNKDGWPDIYVGNDYSPPDYLYINNEGQGFTDEIRTSTGHTSRASMGIDVADVDNDLRSDIFVLDMLAEGNRRQKLLHIPNDRDVFDNNVNSGFHYQYTFNTLQVNNGNDTFSELGQLAGVSNTDWSWAPLIADYNNDGWKDIFITNGLLHDVTNRDFIQYKRNYTSRRNYDLTPRDISVLMDNLPSVSLDNYAFKNEGGLRFTDVSEAWGLDKGINSNGAAYSDLDNDGDVDLVTNNINENASIYENRSSRTSENHYLQVRLRGARKNTYGIGSKLTVYAGSTSQYVEQFPARGYLSSVSPVLHFGLGSRTAVDSVRVVWPDGSEQLLRDVEADQRITLRQENASPGRSEPDPEPPIFREVDAPFAFEHRMQGDIDDFRRQPLMVNPKSFSGPALAKADVNGDGQIDVFVGGGNGQSSALYFGREDGRFTRRSAAFEDARASNDVDAVFFDANGDGAPDLYVASGGYGGFAQDDPPLQDRLYLNDGQGRFSKADGALPRMRTSTGTVAVADVNGDGAADVFAGGRVVPDRYPELPRSSLLVNDGTGHFDDRTAEVAPALEHIGMVTDATWHDLDGTGAKDLLVVGEWMPITVLGNDGGHLSPRTTEYFETQYSGLWNTIFVGDVNGDGHSDILAGNLGTNTQIHATPDEPAEIHYDDFDRNGSVDPILSYYIDGKRYPHVLLDRLRAEMPRIASRFSSYEQYANATLGDVFDQEELSEANRLDARYLETTLLLGQNDGSFARATLPLAAQYAPVFEVEMLDYNRDGDQDLLLAGNINETRIRFGKYDANYGVLLRGNGGGDFEYVPQHESGFQLRGDVRGALQLGDTFVFGINKRGVRGYRLTGTDVDGEIAESRGQ